MNRDRRSLVGSVLAIPHGHPPAGLEGGRYRGFGGDFRLAGNLKNVIEQSLWRTDYHIPLVPIQLNDLPSPFVRCPGVPRGGDPGYGARGRPENEDHD